MKAQFIEHEDQKQQLELIRQQLHSVKDQCDSFRLTMKRFQTTLLEYSHRILKVRREIFRSDKNKENSLCLSLFLFRQQFNSNCVADNTIRNCR